MLLSLLQQYWGYTSFRSIQEDIIRAVMQQQDVLAILPTGAGKSICYQLPALAH
jgi:ATP-dependent DNA helicase RecQ